MQGLTANWEKQLLLASVGIATVSLAIIVVSSYLPELLGLCDRIVVMREGALAGTLPAKGATEEDVLRLASPEGGEHALV